MYTSIASTLTALSRPTMRSQRVSLLTGIPERATSISSTARSRGGRSSRAPSSVKVRPFDSYVSGPIVVSLRTVVCARRPSARMRASSSESA